MKVLTCIPLILCLIDGCIHATGNAGSNDNSQKLANQEHNRFQWTSPKILAIVSLSVAGLVVWVAIWILLFTKAPFPTS